MSLWKTWVFMLHIYLGVELLHPRTWLALADTAKWFSKTHYQFTSPAMSKSSSIFANTGWCHSFSFLPIWWIGSCISSWVLISIPSIHDVEHIFTLLLFSFAHFKLGFFVLLIHSSLCILTKSFVRSQVSFLILWLLSTLLVMFSGECIANAVF